MRLLTLLVAADGDLRVSLHVHHDATLPVSLGVGRHLVACSTKKKQTKKKPWSIIKHASRPNHRSVRRQAGVLTGRSGSVVRSLGGVRHLAAAVIPVAIGRNCGQET